MRSRHDSFAPRRDRAVVSCRDLHDFLVFRITECEFRVHTVPEIANRLPRDRTFVRQSRSSLAIKQHQQATGQTFREQDYRDKRIVNAHARPLQFSRRVAIIRNRREKCSCVFSSS